MAQAPASTKEVACVPAMLWAALWAADSFGQAEGRGCGVEQDYRGEKGQGGGQGLRVGKARICRPALSSPVFLSDTSLYSTTGLIED